MTDDEFDTTTGLYERQKQMLLFEQGWWKHQGAKEQAIKDTFDMSATTYYAVLNRLINLPEAMTFEPMVVLRLRRLRETRTRLRSAPQTGMPPGQR